MRAGILSWNQQSSRLLSHLAVLLFDSHEEEIGFCPSLPIDKINIQYIWEKVDAIGRNSFPLPQNEEFTLLEQELKNLAKDCNESKHNKLVKDL